jgi:predicted DNA-binding ribbon-helix-helix protein
MQHHKYSLTELDEMLPWEREIYVAMLVEHIKEENERQQQLASKQRK